MRTEDDQSTSHVPTLRGRNRDCKRPASPSVIRHLLVELFALKITPWSSRRLAIGNWCFKMDFRWSGLSSIRCASTMSQKIVALNIYFLVHRLLFVGTFFFLSKKNIMVGISWQGLSFLSSTTIWAEAIKFWSQPLSSQSKTQFLATSTA